MAKLIGTMWLAMVWLALFVVHFSSTAIVEPASSFTAFDHVVFLGSFILYGMIDGFDFNYSTVIAFSVQFGFWWLVGIAISNVAAYFKLRLTSKEARA